MLYTLDHDDEVGLGEGDIHRVPHLQLSCVAPVSQVVAIRDTSGAKIRKLELPYYLKLSRQAICRCGLT